MEKKKKSESMRENQWGMEENIKGKELVEREPVKTGLKKWVGMHDGKESGKNTRAIKIKLKNKRLTRMAFHFLFF